MTVEPLLPDVAPSLQQAPRADVNIFGSILNDLGSVLQRAATAEDGFAGGHGDLQTAVYERARADVALSAATAAAQRAAQALQSVVNMQV